MAQGSVKPCPFMSVFPDPKGTMPTNIEEQAHYQVLSVSPCDWAQSDLQNIDTNLRSGFAPAGAIPRIRCAV